MDEFLQLRCGRKVSEQQKVCHLFKVELPVFIPFNQLADLVSLIVQFPLDRDGPALCLLMPVDIRDLCQAGKDAPTVGFAKSSLDIEFLIEPDIHLIRVQRDIGEFSQPFISYPLLLISQHVLPPILMLFIPKIHGDRL